MGDDRDAVENEVSHYQLVLIIVLAFVGATAATVIVAHHQETRAGHEWGLWSWLGTTGAALFVWFFLFGFALLVTRYAAERIHSRVERRKRKTSRSSLAAE